MDELKEIERKIVTAQSMASIKLMVKSMRDNASPNQQQTVALLLVASRKNIIGVARASDLYPVDAGKYAGDHNAIMATEGDGYFFAGMADDIVRGGK